MHLWLLVNSFCWKCTCISCNNKTNTFLNGKNYFFLDTLPINVDTHPVIATLSTIQLLFFFVMNHDANDEKNIIIMDIISMYYFTY